MSNNPINKKTSALEVNEVYSLPTVDGAANEVMKTDGAGTLSWTAISETGNTVNYVYTSSSALITCTTNIAIDDTIPQKTEGDEVLTLTITPKSATNILRISFSSFGGSTSNYTLGCALFQDDTSNALAAKSLWMQTNTTIPFYLEHSMLAGTTSATTFKIRVGTQSTYTVYLNGYNTGPARLFGGVASTTLTITEYKA